jgi:large subunit ribosomal protein L9
MMEVILKKRVEKLGQMGDVVKVKPGFARNFLLRRGLADVATQEKIAEFEKKRSQLEAENLHFKKEAEAVAEKMQGLCLHLVRQASDTGHLYGSVRSKDVAEAITAAGFSIKREQVRIAKPIKTVGVHQVDIVLHPEVSVTVPVAVALSEEEAIALTQQEATVSH